MTFSKDVIWIFLLILLAPFSSDGQNAKAAVNFTIEGRITDFGDGMLVGTISDFKTNTLTLDTILVKNDSFKHKAFVNEKQIVSYGVTDNRFAKYRKAVKDGDTVLVDFTNKKLKAIEIVVFPGVNIRVEGNASSYLNAYSTGSPEEVKIASLNRKLYPFRDSLSDIDYTNKQTFRYALQQEEKFVNSISTIENSFIKNNPSSIISSYLIFQRFQTFIKSNKPEADSLLTLLKPKKGDVYYRRMIFIKNNLAESKKAIKVGEKFPDFKTKFIYKGKNFTLNQTQGKYRLIDFWGTWCIPCVKEMPQLKQFYEKHKDSLTIIGIANDNYQNWTAFLNKHHYNWIQLLDNGPIKLSEDLKVEVYPTKYLLDPSGKIIMIFKDADEGIWSKIESALNIRH